MRSPRPYLRYTGLVHTQEPDVSILTDRSNERPSSDFPFPSLVSNAVADTELHREKFRCCGQETAPVGR